MRRVIKLVVVVLIKVLFAGGSSATSQLLSLNQPAFQSETHYDVSNFHYIASLAVDGNTDSNFVLRSCSATSDNTNIDAWWKVDLGQIYTIETVTIYRRTDCCLGRLRNVELYIGKTEDHYTQQGFYEGILPSPSYTFEMTSLVYGRWVLITRTDDVPHMPLTLCEVQVFGYPVVDDECDTTDQLCDHGSCLNTGSSFSCICDIGWAEPWCDRSYYRLYCFEDDAFGPKAVFRYKSNGDHSITGLQAYDPTIDPRISVSVGFDDPECLTQSQISADIYHLSILINQCGSSSTKRVRVLGTNAYFDIDCTNGGSTLQHEVTDGVTVQPTHEVPFHHVYPNPFDIKCMVFAASGWNAPIWEATYGQDLKLRCIFNKGKMGDARDTWGTGFHIAFPSHTDATFIGLEVYTKGLGTRARIVGYLGGANIDEHVYVKRDLPYRRNIINILYGRTSSGDANWLIENRVIWIGAFDDDVAVRVISYSDTQGYGSSYLALPDHLLSDEYRVPALQSPSDVDAEVVIFAVLDDTDITINYNDFNDKNILQVGGTSTITTPTSTTTKLNEWETLTVRCDMDCSELVITGNKPFGVVFGLDEKEHSNGTGFEGHIMTEITPFPHYGTEFVLVTPAGIIGTFIMLKDDPASTSFVISDYIVKTTEIPFAPYFPDQYDSHVIFASPVGIYFHSEGNATKDPGILPIPSVAQWGNNYYFYARTGRTYTLTFVGKYLDSISFTTGSVVTDLTGTKLSNQANYISNKEAIDTLWTDTDPFYTYELIITVTGTLQPENGGLVEFQAEKKWHSFGLYILETWDGHAETYLPMGVRWTLAPGETVPNADFIRPGDGKDNDNDGHVGEEAQNARNDDGDVAEHVIHDATGIFVHRVEVCDTGNAVDCVAMFEGCYADEYDDERPQYSYLKQFQLFQHNTNLAEEFDHLYVIDSSRFNAWRSISPSDGTIEIEIFYGMCFGNLTKCEDSCKEKRSTDDHEAWAASTRIPFHVNKQDKKGNDEKESAATDNFTSNPCSGKPVFWIPVSMLLFIFLIASMGTGFFLYKRSQFIRRIQNVKRHDCIDQFQKKN